MPLGVAEICCDLGATACKIQGMVLAPRARPVTRLIGAPALLRLARPVRVARLAWPVRVARPARIARLSHRDELPRGFTLVEILAVIAIAGILAATASPILINLLRDRAVARSAMRVSDIFRFARARALESQAVLVTYSSTSGPNSTPGIAIREAVVTQAGAMAPTCAGTNWSDGNAANRLINKFPSAPANPGSNPPWGDAGAELFDPAGASKNYADICYTARGKTFVRYSASDAFTALNGVARIDITNMKSGFRRAIFIPPSTVARLAL